MIARLEFTEAAFAEMYVAPLVWVLAEVAA